MQSQLDRIKDTTTKTRTNNPTIQEPANSTANTSSSDLSCLVGEFEFYQKRQGKSH